MYAVRDSRSGLTGFEKGVAVTVTALAASALANMYLARRAEADYPPIGKFVDVDGVRLHYTETGSGEPVVFLHGNGSMIQDFKSSGLLDLAAQSARVIAFDRPGFGYSSRPDDRAWTPAAQAKLFRKAFEVLSIENPVVVGHSWGTLVAMRLAVDFPNTLKRLVLLSGYYFPSVRADTYLATPGTLPLLGPVIQHTIAPLLGRLMAAPAIAKMFKPVPVSAAFQTAYPTALAVRPSQLSTSSAETAMMPTAVETVEAHYAVRFTSLPERRTRLSTRLRSQRGYIRSYPTVCFTLKKVPGT